MTEADHKAGLTAASSYLEKGDHIRAIKAYMASTGCSLPVAHKAMGGGVTIERVGGPYSKQIIIHPPKDPYTLPVPTD